MKNQKLEKALGPRDLIYVRGEKEVSKNFPLDCGSDLSSSYYGHWRGELPNISTE